MARPYIPETLAELTPEWLTGALRGTGVLREARVVKVESEMLGEGQGFIGDVARLELSLDRDEPSAPRTLIAKLPTARESNRGLGQLGGVYEREIRFYRELGDKVGVRTPRHYYSAMDETAGSKWAGPILRFMDRLPGVLLRLLLRFFTWLAGLSRQRFVLVLEDMAPARIGDQVAGCSRAESERALRCAARLHAGFWDDPRLDSFWWIMPMDIAPNTFRHFLDLGRAPFLERYGDRLTPAVREKLAWLEEHDVELMRELGRPPRTIVHGDFRLDNLFFDDATDEIVLFDWQTLASGLGAFDAAYFLSSLPVGTTPEEEERLMRVYHDELLELGVPDYPWTRFVRDYRLTMLLMLSRLGAATADLIEIGEDRGLELMEGWIERVLDRVEHVPTEGLLEA
ncbi:MAG: phosphotransferase [Deltaproteobacteria bacterium]|nr:phosphotransferase [Deltaproteobacteria bacterium]MBW2412978.1 phosphotransferase [Deltaproteobacteria bacterium]